MSKTSNLNSDSFFFQNGTTAYSIGHVIAIVEQDIKMLGNGLCQSDKEDLVQDALERILKYRSSYDSSKDLKGWIYRICQNLVRDYKVRTFNGNRFLLNKDISEYDSYALSYHCIDLIDGANVIDGADQLDFVHSQIDSLSNDKYQQILRMVESGFTTQEISDTMGISTTAVLTHLCRARKGLKRVG